MKTAVFPGSFDPIHNGHREIVERMLPLFDKLIMAVGVNADKKYLFTTEQRLQWLKEVFGNEPKISIEQYSGLTADFCKKRNAAYLIRGLRNSSDFEFEKAIAQMNRKLGGIETVFVISSPEHAPLSSTILRDIIVNGGSVNDLVPVKITM
ncbi:MAG: pantetheine-phosphate adenylyltransferase [Bacteroidetes bacterium]|nr:MAG: phosphopantetheine adenylyltransferase [Bacteroidetes bacterium OLB10]MBX3107436.1 pantetheine-phosphate adenylyltransferase [Bacteroidota bacterium]MCB8929686.1 pantetheine-phosphate adenylyltransferase [Bacteroidia bacterium]MCE7955835.1 pantetheine-phosphate adenylyltransferase [Bacteroidetes bacterium CHB6]MCB0848188.1 pantetheine-phosphate adenylyltransferase [Bacteroidota bacterium]